MIAPKGYPEQRPNPRKLVDDHMGLVRRLAWLFHARVSHFVDIEDLMQAGYVGLVEASARYSVREGVTFAAYAAIRIRGGILDMLRRNSNLCRKTITMRQTVSLARAKMAQQLGREPNLSEVAQALDMNIEELQDWENRFQANKLQSLDEVYTDQSLLFSDNSLSPEKHTELGQLKGLLREAVEELPERQALVLQLCYVEELNVYEMSAILDVTPGRISQLKKAAITQLREILKRRLED